MSTTNYSPEIFGDPHISVLPLDGETRDRSQHRVDSSQQPRRRPPHRHVHWHFRPPSPPSGRHRGAVSRLLSSIFVPSSLQLLSSVAEKILEALARACRGVDVAANDQFPDGSDYDDEDDDDDFELVPASTETIVGLKRDKIRVSSVLTCSVCSEDIPVGSESIRLPCSHCYHEDCIVEWLSRSRFCPICRFELV